MRSLLVFFELDNASSVVTPSFCKWHVNRWFVNRHSWISQVHVHTDTQDVPQAVPDSRQFEHVGIVLVFHPLLAITVIPIHIRFHRLKARTGQVRSILRRFKGTIVFPLSILISGLNIKLDSQIMRVFELVQHRVAQVSLIDPFDRLDSKTETCGLNFKFSLKAILARNEPQFCGSLLTMKN